MALNRLATTASMRKVGRRSALSSEDWNASLSEVLVTLATIESEWNVRLQPLIDSLPGGKRSVSVESVSGSPDPVTNGLDGSNIYMDNVASSTRDDGLFWNATLSRSRTIKESVLEVRSELHTAVADLQALIIDIDTSSGLTPAQKTAIGDAIFDPAIPSTASSNQGRSTNNQLNLNQLAADVFNVGDSPNGAGDALDPADYVFDNDGLRNKVTGQSIQEQINALAGGAATLDTAYTNGQIVTVDLANPSRWNMAAVPLATEVMFIQNTVADTTDGLRLDRQNAAAGGYALWVENGQTLMAGELSVTFTSSSNTQEGIDVALTSSAGGAGVKAGVRSTVDHTGTGTGYAAALKAVIPATFTSNTANPVGLHIDSAPAGSGPAFGVDNVYATTNLTGEPTAVHLYRAILTHDNAGQAPSIVNGVLVQPTVGAGADTLPELNGFFFDPDAAIDATVTDLYGFRGRIAAGSSGTVTNLYGLHFTLDATNLGSTISRGLHLDLTAIEQGIFIDHNGAISGGDGHGIQLDADVTLGSDDYYGLRFDIDATQNAGGPASVYGASIDLADGNHLDHPTAIRGYHMAYSHTDASHGPGIVEGIDVNLDLSAGAVVPSTSRGINLDLTDVKQGIYVNMDGTIPAATTWSGLHLEAGAVTAADDARILRGAFIDLDGSGIGDSDRIVGLEISMPTGMRNGILFTADGEHDIGQAADKRPRNIYCHNLIQVGATVSITTDTITGSGATTITTTAGSLSLTPNTTLDVGAGTKSDGKRTHPAAEVQTINATPTTIKSVTLELDHTYHIKAIVVGQKSDGLKDQHGSYHLEGTFYRESSAAQLGATTSVHTAESDTNWDCNFVLNGNDVEVQVTGTADTIEWVCILDVVDVSV